MNRGWFKAGDAETGRRGGLAPHQIRYRGGGRPHSAGCTCRKHQPNSGYPEAQPLRSCGKRHAWCSVCRPDIATQVRQAGSRAWLVTGGTAEGRAKIAAAARREARLHPERLIPWMRAGRAALGNLKPNNCERRLEEIIGPLGFRFVGDRVRFLGTKSPDFVHEKLPIVIEFFGSFWHRNDSGRARRRYFARRGYRTVIIRGETALDRPEAIQRRVLQVLAGGQ